MTRRYSDIRRGARLAQALTQYTNYLSQSASRVPGVGTGQARPAQVNVAIQPFNADVEATERWLARVGEPSRNFLRAAVGTSAPDTTEAAPGVKVPGFKPAKIVVFAGSGTSVAATSAITGQRYLKYNGQTYSHPFGRATATDRMQDRFNAIRAAAEGPNRRFSLRDENIRLA